MPKKVKGIVCLKTGGRSLTKADCKAVRNFAEFLRGEGNRCCLCLHKAGKHNKWLPGTGCGAEGCDCSLSRDQVMAVRIQQGAPRGPEVPY